ncbi:hypothetical protein PENSUB_5800 [Penicillium subrubescens]|uniref:Uncharacterized protein n=1 Tax=Penicillium subrubescens TaxID=1316194 RepID=A0A1Q5U5B9_9EURO|nr:hypothetical protein PENSUB_5800 [Penicillium subrubescens]
MVQRRGGSTSNGDGGRTEHPLLMEQVEKLGGIAKSGASTGDRQRIVDRHRSLSPIILKIQTRSWSLLICSDPVPYLQPPPVGGYSRCVPLSII